MATQAREHVTHNEAMEKVKEVYKERGQTYSFMVRREKINDTGRVIPEMKNKVEHRPKQTCAQATRLEHLPLINRTMDMTPTNKNTIGGDGNKTKKTNKGLDRTVHPAQIPNTIDISISKVLEIDESEISKDKQQKKKEKTQHGMDGEKAHKEQERRQSNSNNCEKHSSSYVSC